MKSILLFTEAVLLLIGLATISACKQAQTDDDQQIALLVEKKWQTKQLFTRDTLGNYSQDIFPAQPSYVKDNYSIWHGDRSFAVHDNVDRHPQNPRSLLDSGSWDLKQSFLYTLKGLDSNQIYMPGHITELTSDDLTIEYESYPGPKIYYVYKMVRIQ